MSDHETDHQRRRRERAERKAEYLARKAQGQFTAARAELEHIPLGQPILVGHHSERRHRKAIERSHNKTRRALDTARAAESAKSAAMHAGYAISSDDPDAIPALVAKLEELEARRERIKASNRSARKEGRAALPRYVLSNLGANIRRVRRRIAELKANAERTAAPVIEGDGFTIEECPDDNRIRFTFDARPDKETTAKMKRAGFRWSRRNGAWQRHLNNGGRYAAKHMARELFGWNEGTADA